MAIYPAKSLERAMKFQEVILRAMSKEITWIQAAEILGMSDRNMRRYRNRLGKGGYDGMSLIDQRTKRPSPKRVPMATAEKVLQLYREQYFDFNVLHFHEKLVEEHKLELSYTWVKNALQGAGLVGRKKKRGGHHKRRPRRPLPGMMMHIDGSTHAWLGPEHDQFDLVTLMDDATSEIYYGRFVDEENTETIMAGLRSVVERQGVFCALYSDRASHFVCTPKGATKPDRSITTQVGRALEQLGIELFLPTHRKRGDAASVRTAPSRGGCLRRCAPPVCGRSSKPMPTWPSTSSATTRSSSSRPQKKELPSCPITAPI